MGAFYLLKGSKLRMWFDKEPKGLEKAPEQDQPAAEVAGEPDTIQE